MDHKIAIITDDFTSAMDHGASFSKFGLKTGVVLETHYIKETLNEFDVLVIDPESRSDSEEVAFSKVLGVVKILKNSKITYIYKSIYSTLRGNIGKEIEAAMIASERPIAIVAPTYPINGRTTLGGIQLFSWIPLEKTEFAKDPISPASFSLIENIVASQTDKRIININLQDVMKGPENIAATIKKLTVYLFRK